MGFEVQVWDWDFAPDGVGFYLYSRRSFATERDALRAARDLVERGMIGAAVWEGGHLVGAFGVYDDKR